LTAAKAVPIERELERRGHRLKRMGHELVGPCPVCGGNDRFGVNVQKRLWNCRGCAKGGDILALVQHLDGVAFGDAVKTLTGKSNCGGGYARKNNDAELSNMLADAMAAKIERKQPKQPDLIEAAGRIWRETVAIAGTPGEDYLERRGVALNRVPNHGGLRF